jgi:hypothetical protein
VSYEKQKEPAIDHYTFGVAFWGINVDSDNGKNESCSCHSSGSSGLSLPSLPAFGYA